jgi:hypothetical protein
MTTAVVLGEGVLTWRPVERVGDRYGAVSLMAEGGNSLADDVAWVPLDRTADGQRGRLEAHVLATRQSSHIGDLFRGFAPSTPEVGETIRLGGPGTLFFEDLPDPPGPAFQAVGLRPDDGRATDWLDPEALYRAHEQTVRLMFAPTT